MEVELQIARHYYFVTDSAVYSVMSIVLKSQCHHGRAVYNVLCSCPNCLEETFNSSRHCMNHTATSKHAEAVDDLHCRECRMHPDVWPDVTVQPTFVLNGDCSAIPHKCRLSKSTVFFPKSHGQKETILSSFILIL